MTLQVVNVIFQFVGIPSFQRPLRKEAGRPTSAIVVSLGMFEEAAGMEKH